MLVWSGLVWSIYILFPQLRSYLLLIFSLLQSFSDMLYGRFAKLMEDIYIYILRFRNHFFFSKFATSVHIIININSQPLRKGWKSRDFYHNF